MVRLTDRPNMTLDVYRGRKTTTTSDKPMIFFYFLSVGKFSYLLVLINLVL